MWVKFILLAFIFTSNVPVRGDVQMNKCNTWSLTLNMMRYYPVQFNSIQFFISFFWSKPERPCQRGLKKESYQPASSTNVPVKLTPFKLLLVCEIHPRFLICVLHLSYIKQTGEVSSWRASVCQVCSGSAAFLWPGEAEERMQGLR